jgi:hypothetical protein
LSKKILFERIKNANITALLKDNEIVFDISQKLTARINDNGIIEVS